MAADLTFLTRIVDEFADLIDPILRAVEDPVALAELLTSQGWLPPADPSSYAGIQSALGAAARIEEFAPALARLAADPSAENVGAAVALTGKLLASLREPTAPSSANLVAPFDDPAFWTTFLRGLADDLVGQWLHRSRPALFALLHLLGLVDLEQVGAAGTGRFSHQRLVVRWEDLPRAFTAPNELLADRYGWGQPDVDVPALIDNLGRALAAFALPVGTRTPPTLLTNRFWSDVADPPPMLSLDVPLVRVPLEDARLDVSLEVLPLPPVTGPATWGGLVVLPTLDAAAAETLPLGPVFRLGFDAALSDLSWPAAEIRPGQPIRVETGETTFSGELGIELVGMPDQPFLLVGTRHGPRIELTRVTLRFAVETSGQEPEFRAELSLDGLTATLDLGAGDALVGKTMGQGEHQTGIDAAVVWSSRTGLAFRGAPHLELSVPMTLALGPARVNQVTIGLTTPGDERIALPFTIDAAATLGPFSVAVSRIGVTTEIATAPGDLRDGASPVSWRFKPPTGAGIAIDAAAVKGGGFLLFDEDAGRYVGVFELTLLDTISVKAIAIVNTKNPDGTPGFALLVMITAEGFAPIPLGMGFTLTGIGGLLAINHTFDAKAITDGLRSGVLDSILFVKDPVKNISRVLGTLDKVFPVAQDRLVVGPLAEISWGTPTMVRIRLALVLELPQPVRVALLAAITVQLPDPKVPVVDLHIDAAGILDFGRKTFALDASLHDSKIAGFTLTGDMSLRLGWGDDPGFLASFGGFHPKFKPPPDVRPLQRLALSLTSSDNPRVRFEAYLAVTSNTLQLGARADVHAEAAGLALDAGGSFDALLQLVPFSLDVAFAAWARISAGGATLLAISISVDVTGPAPWHITGQATISILFISATVGIDLTVGEAPAVPPVLESVDVGDAIWSQLGDPARWEAALPAATRPGAILLTGGAPTDGAPLVAHPLSRVTARQQAAPLDHRVDCVGARVPTRGSRTYSATVKTTTGVTSSVVQDQFAPAQFQKLTQDQQLTAPSFVPMNSGVALTPAEESASGPQLSWDFALQTLDVTSLDEPASPGPAVAATDATARGPVDPAADLAQTVTVAAS